MKEVQFIDVTAVMPGALKARQEARSTLTHQVYAHHIGYFLGGKCTLIVTFDEETRMTADEWEKHNKEVEHMISTLRKGK